MIVSGISLVLEGGGMRGMFSAGVFEAFMQKELIFQDTFWSSLYPNSIAVLDDKNVFIGMRSGIVKLDLTTKTLKFYKNDK